MFFFLMQGNPVNYRQNDEMNEWDEICKFSSNNMLKIEFKQIAHKNKAYFSN